MKSVFDYTDYHQFLREYYADRKSISHNFSYRYICNKTAIKSTGHLSLIFQGKAHISLPLAMKLSELCKLKKREREYWIEMVLYNQAKNHEDKKRHFKRMAAFKESSVYQVHAAQYSYYEKWHHSVIRALLERHDFRDEYETIGKLVIPAITAEETRKSVELLVQLQLVAKDENGYYRPTNLILDSGTRAPAVAVNNFVLDTLGLAREALDRFPREERHLSWTTVSLSRDGLAEAIEEARHFRKRLYAIAEADRAERVFQVNMQIFPVSQVLLPEDEAISEAHASRNEEDFGMEDGAFAEGEDKDLELPEDEA